MASSKSPSQVELVAIYRLEFYKKQKNWKFSKDVCKKNPPETVQAPEECKKPTASANSSESILNKTYCLDTEIIPCDINDAFLEPDPATLPDRTHLEDVKNCTQSISETDGLDQKWPELEQQWPELEQQWPDSPKQWPVAQEQWPVWPDANSVWTVPEVPEQRWQNVGQKWGGEACFPPAEALRAYEADAWPQQHAQAQALEPCGELQPEALLGEAEAWLRERWPQHEDTRSLSMESLESFMRGAAAAPHSSEVDLNLSRGDRPLSARSLAAEVSRHAAALRSLLHEAQTRSTQHRPRSTFSEDYLTPTVNLSCEDRPTRDTESFVAGSFGNQLPTGRGRGRLHRTRLIGIGMGRPYRL